MVGASVLKAPYYPGDRMHIPLVVGCVIIMRANEGRPTIITCHYSNKFWQWWSYVVGQGWQAITYCD